MTHQSDYLVIGSGLAGLTFALKAAEHGQVCVLTKAEPYESNTNWAQGGIAAAVGEADDWRLHEEDTLIAGAGLCSKEAVRYLVQNAPAAIEWLSNLGTRFDTAEGNFALGLEGGHSRSRIVHHADKTGWEIERAVLEAVRKQPNITVYGHSYVTNLLSSNGRACGARVVTEGAERTYLSRSVMLATGGCGRMYQHTTNPRVATGDGIALAHQLGAQIKNMEFMQFHPTTLYHDQARSFLISEAVRGAGATLRNHLGRRFMYDYDERLELAPRDIVARAIHNEIQRLQTWCVYLDTTHLKREPLIHEFPTIYEKLQALGLEMEKEWIPIVPAQHYSCGGVVTDLGGRTSVPGLYAAGEVACTGVHGANRLASNSLLEAVVFAGSAADSAVKDEIPDPSQLDPVTVPKSIAEADAVRIRRALGKTMMTGAGIVRTNAGLAKCLASLTELQEEYIGSRKSAFTAYALETHNLLTAAEYVVKGAQARSENVGLHYNTDLPNTAQSSV